MILTLTRKWATSECTIGLLDVDGVPNYYVLEDVEREGELKVPGKTAIPRGTYKIVIDYSNRFKRRLPRLLDVPGFTGIRIHPGNVSGDTDGCLLPGMERYENSVGHSVVAFSNLFGQMLMAEARAEPITIEIRGALETAVV
jgi:Family of unknown function (DUF5675)